MKGGSGPWVEEKGISINETLLSSFWREVEFASNCCRIVCALWSSFAFAIHSSSHLAQNFIKINMHLFLAQFSFTHSQLNLHTSFQISLHSHVDQSLLNPSFSQGLVAFTSNLRISYKATPFRQKGTSHLAGRFLDEQSNIHSGMNPQKMTMLKCV